MSTLDIARWQFASTTVFHFLFVPLSIGLGLLVAGMQTAWVRTGAAHWLALTRFYGKLYLINVGMGIVTGIVQEFQFGMNFSAYSRFVGDVFGAPLAMEALLAFFLESTFLGLWIFGWDRLPRRVHLATIWIAAAGSVASAYAILVANSWMQHPVGFRVDPATHRAVLTDITAVLTNKVALITFPHTLAGCLLAAGALVAAVAVYHLRRGAQPAAFRAALRLGCLAALAGGLALVVTGDLQGKIMTQVQPMKMAAAEALYHTQAPASFSLLSVGTLDGRRELYAVTVPHVLSFLATGTLDGRVQGIDDLQAQYAAAYGPGSYTPLVPLSYWSFRLMIAVGLAGALIALLALWATRRGRAPTSRLLARLTGVWPLLPLAGNSLGWIFTETGRQPWLVFGQLTTAAGVSPTVSAASAATSLVAFTLLYGVLAVVEVRLLLHAARAGLADPHDTDEPGDPQPATTPLAFSY